MGPRIDVVYAARMKPGDLYAGNVDPDLPTRPVQEFAAAHTVTSVTPYTEEDTGARMLAIRAGGFDLTPVPFRTQAMVIRLT